MHCVFCKRDSTSSRSVEHIIPESLGNRSLTLPPGVVCDGCNNYFATKVEKPFLESAAITLLRFHQEVPSKRGRVPTVVGMMPPGTPVVLRRDPRTRQTSVDVPPEAFERVLSGETSQIVLPFEAELTPGPTVTRFLAKAALESLAARLVEYPGGLNFLVEEAQFDPLRDHARRGLHPEWEFNVRRIYPANAKWIDATGESVQLVHESDIFTTESNEWYFVLALFGLELVINYGGPHVDGYRQWLLDNADRSPLYWGKNTVGAPLRPEP